MSDSHARILGGIMSQPNQWPFMAAIFYIDLENYNQSHPVCGGIVWNSQTILTAAHCLITQTDILNYIKVENLKVYLGHVKTDRIDQTYMFKVRKTIIHQRFDLQSLSHDIGLIILESSIDFDNYHSKVRCVCDPESDMTKLQTNICKAMGWGYINNDGETQSSDLQEVDLPILDQHECAEKHHLFQSHWNICAGHANGKKDTCGGDSGGPLMCPYKDNPNDWSLVGITSFGNPNCGLPGEPGYFIRVAEYIKWIKFKSGEGVE
ncbi:hypothetical protein BLOT_000441 [Blomia tropicalis]|nr:hypothetical protein BLOT_000441 [Blomia tropicalis]